MIKSLEVVATISMILETVENVNQGAAFSMGILIIVGVCKLFDLLEKK